MSQTGLRATDIAVLLALCAAFASAIGNIIRQRSAQDVTDKPVRPLALFGMLLRDTRWRVGAVAALLSFGLQAVALRLGSVILVETLQLTVLLFVLPVYARISHQRITRREWVWSLLLATALPVFLSVGEPAAGHQRAPLQTWAVVSVVLGPVLVLCVLGARIWSGPVSAVLLAVVSASSWALFAVLTKGLVDMLDHGLGQVLRAPELYGWMVCALAGTVFQQSAFRAGALGVSLSTMAVTEPAAAWVLAAAVLGETLKAGGPEVFILAAAMMVAAVAAVALARGEAAMMSASTAPVTSLDSASISDPVVRRLIEGAAEDQTSLEQTLVPRSPQNGRSHE